MKLIYMGTPDFAVAPLENLINAGHEILLVVTQPDRQKGRGKGVAISPVKECAIKHSIPVFQPEKIREKANVEVLKKYDADAYIVAAFGQILSEEILNMPRYGCINIHASLLPKLRGASPIQWSILKGDEKTGVTIMQMAKGIDDGDILMQEELVIDKKDTGDSLFDKLMYLGADLIVKALSELEAGHIVPKPQNEREATHVGKISKELGRIDWNKDADTIERYIRGLNSWPSAYTFLDDKMLKIWEGEVVEAPNNISSLPGTVIDVKNDAITVMTQKDALKITSLQLEGKKRMSTHDFLLGYKIMVGKRL